MKNLVMLVSLSVMSVGAFAANKVIYGDDNRVDVYASTNSAFVELSKSTAAMIKNKDLKKRFLSRKYKINGSTLRSDLRVCSDEPFANQPSAANCSGFLVGENLLVTAGHCIKSMSDCNGAKWVFDYKMENESQANLKHSKDTIYSCKKIVSRSLDRASKDDFALIELDRNVTGRTPLKFRTSGKPSVGDELVVIGHPSGLPTKIADGAQVKSLEGAYFMANLDTYGGNSGSAVFNVSTGEIEGILVRGATDYVSRGNCRASNRIGNDEGAGEGVTYITNIKALMDM